MSYLIERFEDNGWTVLEREDGLTFNVPSEWLPEEAQEGHVLTLEPQVEGKESRLHFTLDEAETKRRTEAAQGRLDRLPKGPQGDLEL